MTNMKTHELILLSPYKFPAQYAMTLSDEDMAAWLNGFTALWHPAVMWQASAPPRCETTYDHETPKSGMLYALPETPPSYFSDDWAERVKQAGSIVFKATPDRAATLANLRDALHADGAPAFGWKEGIERAETEVGPFFGMAWGHQMLAALTEAMEHENLLDQASFWDDVQHAVALLAGMPYTPTNIAAPPTPAENTANDDGMFDNPSDTFGDPPPVESEAASESGPIPQEVPPVPKHWREVLVAAATKMLSAREVLYPVAIHLLDVSFLDATSDERANHAALELGVPMNVISDTRTLEIFSEKSPTKFAELRDAVQGERVEVLSGGYVEREDPILPIDSQLWNLRHGLDRAKELLGVDVRVYARKRFGYHPHLPLFLSSNGITKALFLTFDENSGLPHYSNVVVSWPSPDGKQVDAFARQPKFADSPETYFNLGHTWFKTTREDQAATVFLLHRDKPTAVWHRDLMELARLAPLLGQWTTFSRYLTEVMPSEYPSTMTADDFHFDFLSDRITAKADDPVSMFAKHHRTRRRIDACWTYAALHRALSGSGDTLNVSESLAKIEMNAETTLTTPTDLDETERRITSALAHRLQSRSEPDQPGYMILNPCGFTRRVALELDGARHPLPISGVVKACQLDADKMRAVIEVPALGFAWLPREGPPGTPLMTLKMRAADAQSNTIRNDFFEVEIDAKTGGLKAIRDHKTRVSRLGQMLVFNPGSRMVSKEIKVTSSGPALAEIVSEGVLLGEQDQVLANFRQRFRLWMGRPLLEMRVEITPQQPPAGYGWHAYFGSRFAWRDERAALVRGFNGMGYITTHPRPQTPDYFDIRLGAITVSILTGGLPFHQKQGNRMVDVILIPEGEKCTTFDFGIAFDREVPMQTAWGFTSPIGIVPTTKGPPHIGTSGWLFHVDASNLLLTRMMPGLIETSANKEGVADAVTARFLECANYSGLAEFRCVRDPQRAAVFDTRGQFVLEANRSGDIVHLEVTPNDLAHVQVEFSLAEVPPPTTGDAS